jgi:ABC-type transport system involved in multi-copper enzyme maturation permease subunit
MIRLKMMMAIARAEARLTRRLVRYWVFMLMASFIGLIGYAYYSTLHYHFSSMSGTVGSVSPRYLVGAIGFYYLFVFLVGLLFLGMDVRGRDIRERMVEVLDALPCSNLELVLGKYLGVLIPSWIPLALVALLIFGAGFIWGESVSPYSLVYFVFFMAIPAFTFILGMVYLVALLVRHRGLASILLLILMAAIYFANFQSPIWLAPANDMIGGFLSSFPSDLIPEVVNGEGVAHRFAIMLMGLGMLWLAAGFHPRKDDGGFARYIGVGLLMIAVALASLGWIVYARKKNVDLIAQWKAAHEARLADPAPDVVSITGNVVVEPGDSVSLDLEITLGAGSDGVLHNALFTLNPGIVVSEAADAEGRTLSFTQENGLLDFTLNETLVAGEPTSIRLKAEGLPAEFFGYLDGARNPMTLTNLDGQLFLLGFVPIIFQDDHVSLLPGCRWLPLAGVEVDRGDAQKNPTDFFTIDLTVAVPQGWIAALPGKRQDAVTDRPGMTAYRFAPGAPVDQVALIADEYVSRSTEVSGVHAEILLHPSHVANLDVFSDSVTVLEDWMAEKLDEAAALGLPYPYDAITVVEIPNVVRGYGGGWRLGSTLAPSAMVLMKESGFPTSRFDVKFKDPDDFEDRDGGMPAAKVERLERFFDNDFNGGNLFAAASRNFFTGLTAGEGAEGLPLDFVFEELSSRLVAGRYSYFSAYLFTPDMGEVIGQSIGGYFETGGRGDFVDTLISTVTSRASVWDKALGVSLDQLDPWEEPRDTLDILTLKGGAMAQSMLDDLGREETGTFLAALRETSAGGSYSREDVLAAGRKAGTDLAPWLDTWIGQTDLPGFLVPDDAVEAYRLEDTEDGSPRYQILVRVTNGESVPGLLRVEYEAGDYAAGIERGTSDPVKVPGGGSIEIGLVSSKPPNTVKVLPYLSLNRTPFTLGLGTVDSEDVRDGEPFTGSREVTLTSREAGVIVVDDLDDGFETSGGAAGSRMRIKGKRTNVETDRGLPVMTLGRTPSEWSRHATPEAYGKYRHTFALVKGGSGERTAVFTAEIPAAGSWDLEVYLPKDVQLLRLQRKAGSWNYAIEDAGGSRTVTLDVRSGESGWNSLGSFELAGGETRVILSDETESRTVVADAIRWAPSSGSSNREMTEE